MFRGEATQAMVRHFAAGLALSLVAAACTSTGTYQEAQAVDLRFVDVADEVGLDFRHGAFRWGVSADPAAMMGGGLCWIDYDADGWLDLFLVNTYAEAEWDRWQGEGGLPRSALYRNRRGQFVDVTDDAGVGLEVRGNGCVAADLDLDGRAELLLANGHIADTEAESGVPLAQPAQVLSYTGRTAKGIPRFVDRTPPGGLAGAPLIGRGLATADVDGDGDVVVLVLARDAAPRLLRNDLPKRGRGLRLLLEGLRPGDQGLGAAIELRAGDRAFRGYLRSGGSYGGESERAWMVGLPIGARPESLIVRWPDGAREAFDVPTSATVARLVRGRGALTVASAPTP
ncbi:MAG: CRTAC1 family protein, partial [Acidobacteria bacterium]|nr:CRTAC1 family protein [Acidobacteriota bacterium]